MVLLWNLTGVLTTLLIFSFFCLPSNDIVSLLFMNHGSNLHNVLANIIFSHFL